MLALIELYYTIINGKFKIRVTMSRKTEPEHSAGIECPESIWARSFLIVALIVWTIWIMYDVFSGLVGRQSHPLWWLPWLVSLVIFPVAGPDLVFYDSGISIKLWWTTLFIPWDDVKGAHKTSMHVRITVNRWPESTSEYLKRTLNSGLVFGRWRKNYGLVERLMKQKLENRFLETL
jgi:hypothetical protein